MWREILRRVGEISPSAECCMGEEAVSWPREPQNRCGFGRGGDACGTTLPGIRFASCLVVLHLDPLAPRTPRLPRRRFSALTQLTASIALHVGLVVVAASIATSAPGVDTRRTAPIAEQPAGPLVFVAPAMPRTSGGGGGGGNRQSAPIRRAQGVGSDAITLRVRKDPAAPVPTTTASTPPVESIPSLPSMMLDAKPLSLGLFDQVGLPTGGVLSGYVARSRVRRRCRFRHRDRCGVGTGPGTWPWIGRRNWRRRLSRWRDRLHAAAAQGGQTQVHQRGALEQNSGHGHPGSRGHSRRMHVPDPRRSLPRRSGPRSRGCGGCCSMAVRPWPSRDVPVDVLVTIVLDFTIR